MEETFFEMLERTRAVDKLLFWLAVLTPPLIAGAAALLRQHKMVTKHRHRWVMACLAAPGLLVLWKMYNLVVERFGLDSVLGLFVNICVFAAAAMLATGLRLVLRATLANGAAMPSVIGPAPVGGKAATAQPLQNSGPISHRSRKAKKLVTRRVSPRVNRGHRISSRSALACGSR